MLLGAQMATYDQCKTVLKRDLRWSAEGVGEYRIQFAASIVTGLAVTCTTSPVTNARTHIMTNPPGTFRGTLHCWSDIVSKQGPLGLYRGFGAQWARFGPYAIVQFLVWERLRLMCGMEVL